MLLLLTGCLLFQAAPPRCPDSCGAYSCDASGACLDRCNLDDDCASGFICSFSLGTCGEACVDAECPDGLTCEYDQSACKTHCTIDDDCQAGLVCGESGCEAPCQDDACPDGYACDTFANACYSDCMGLDSYCQEGWHCCDYGESGCDMGDECVRD